MDPKIRQSWDDFLNPDVMRPKLTAASIYVIGFEFLKESITQRVRDFFWIGFDESGDKIDPKYESHVLSRNRSPVYACLDWMKELGVVNDDDVAKFEQIKRCRNKLAHELFNVLGSEGLPTDFEYCFVEMAALLRKIEV